MSASLNYKKSKLIKDNLKNKRKYIELQKAQNGERNVLLNKKNCRQVVYLPHDVRLKFVDVEIKAVTDDFVVAVDKVRSSPFFGIQTLAEFYS